MFDFQFTAVRRFDGTTRAERAIEVFNTVTGTTIAFCRRRPFEAKQAWIDRAIQSARMAVS